MDVEKTLQYLMDRHEIEDKCILYASLVDTKQFDRFTELFTPDAYFDYRASGGIEADLTATIEYLKKATARFRSMHMMTNIACEIAPDRKTAKTTVMLHNPMTFVKEDGNDHTFYCGLWYHDDWVLTDDGWKMKRRVQTLSYTHNSPFHGKK
ncbi:MAG: nuclear transport factor 2 family protein [Oscillospiraceae bacterium]|nr:nuclear transport factor 2 family protein [Oscillospiraceae bacterium]